MKGHESFVQDNQILIVQQQLIETTTSASLTQIHDQPTRADNMLDLVFTSNPSLIKTSVSVPGISDHDIVITDMEIKPRDLYT